MFLPRAQFTTIAGAPARRGDINGNGEVYVIDVNEVINMILGKADKVATADLNVDSEIDVTDVNMIINIILGKE